MTQEIQFQTLPLTHLVYHCRIETNHFFRRQAHDSRYAYELFRRALETPHTPESKEAWQHIDAIYKPLARRWAYKHWRFEHTATSSHTFAEEGLERMWSVFANSPGKFNADDFPTLACLLAYLKLCVYTAVKNYPLSSHEDIDTLQQHPTTSTASEAHQFWHCIEKRLSNHKQRIVAYESFVKESKPSDIYADYPNLFENTKHIYKIKYNIIKKLRFKGTELRTCFDDI